MAKKKPTPGEEPVQTTEAAPPQTGSRHLDRYMVNIGPYRAALKEYQARIKKQTRLAPAMSDIVRLALREFFEREGIEVPAD